MKILGIAHLKTRTLIELSGAPEIAWGIPEAGPSRSLYRDAAKDLMDTLDDMEFYLKKVPVYPPVDYGKMVRTLADSARLQMTRLDRYRSVLAQEQFPPPSKGCPKVFRMQHSAVKSAVDALLSGLPELGYLYDKSRNAGLGGRFAQGCRL